MKGFCQQEHCQRAFILKWKHFYYHNFITSVTDINIETIVNGDVTSI